MAVVTVTETMVRDSSVEGLANQSGPALIQKFTAKRSYTVTCDDVNDGPVVAGNAALIPKFGDKHPKDTTLIVNEIEPKAAPGSAKIFIVTVTYQRIGSVAATSPLLEPPEAKWSSVPGSLATQWDTAGQLFATTAGEAFDDRLAKAQPDAILDYSFNSLSPNANLIFTHVGRVNGATWTTSLIGAVPAWCALFNGIVAESKWSLGLAYYRVTYQFAFRDRLMPAGSNIVAQNGGAFSTTPGSSYQIGWMDCRVNMGNLYLDANGKQKTITAEGDSLPGRQPFCLSADGKTVIRNPTPSTAVYILFYPYLIASFAQLGVI